MKIVTIQNQFLMTAEIFSSNEKKKKKTEWKGYLKLVWTTMERKSKKNRVMKEVIRKS